MNPPPNRRVKSAGERLKEIRRIIESVDARCLAADGAVTRFQDEVWDQELRRIYRLTAPKRTRK